MPAKKTKKEAPKAEAPKKEESILDMVEKLTDALIAKQADCYMARNVVRAMKKVKRLVKSNTILSGE